MIRRLVFLAALALTLAATASPASAATIQGFDNPGSAYVLTQHAAPPPPAVMAGGLTGSFLRIATDAAIPQNNSISFARTDPGAFCEIVAELDFRMIPVDGRADGMGFALLNTARWGGSGAVAPQAPWFVAEEPDFAGSLGVGFDLHQSNDIGDLDGNHVSIHFDGVRLQDFNAGAIDLGSGSFIHARIEIHTGDAIPNVDVFLTPAGGSPVAVVTDFPIPGLKPYEGRAWFGGRSGGQSAHHDLDNVSLTFTGCPATLGEWSSVFPFEAVAIHTHLLPTGKILYWDRHDFGDGMPRFWDPESGAITPAPEPEMGHDIFCSGHSFLKDGRLLVTGGHISDAVGQATVGTFDPFSNTWTRHPDMNAGRWYPTNTTLANGDVLTVSGTVDTMTVNTLPQVFQAASQTWRDLSGAHRALPFYPFMYLAPNGKVFHAGPQPVTSYLDTSGTGAWTDVAISSNGFREYGSSVLYDEGRILISGGSPPDGITPPTASAEIIDLGSASPAWSATDPMAFARRQHNATLLPDGTVLITGGTSATGFNNSTGAVLAAELWDPATGDWRTLAGMQVPRLYHSVALLLPDGRVLSAGGGHPSDFAHGDPDHPDAEIYSPPYLFKGPRPSIASAPQAVPYGQPFFVGTPDAAAIASVTLIRLSSVTHGFNQEQRIVRPAFTTADGGLEVTAPSDPQPLPARVLPPVPSRWQRRPLGRPHPARGSRSRRRRARLPHADSLPSPGHAPRGRSFGGAGPAAVCDAHLRAGRKLRSAGDRQGPVGQPDGDGHDGLGAPGRLSRGPACSRRQLDQLLSGPDAGQQRPDPPVLRRFWIGRGPEQLGGAVPLRPGRERLLRVAATSPPPFRIRLQSGGRTGARSVLPARLRPS